ncbi:MAG: hypothetical protein ACYTXI_36600 [Nostoc sp.]
MGKVKSETNCGRQSSSLSPFAFNLFPFIDAAIQAYITQIQTEKLRQQLKEGAIRRAGRDRQLTDDWFALEEEAWHLCPRACHHAKFVWRRTRIEI